MGGAYFSSKNEAVPSSEMSVNFYQNTRFHIAEYDKFPGKKYFTEILFDAPVINFTNNTTEK
jgi:hypothetical protein